MPNKPRNDRPCPLCGKPAVQDFRPFCSRGCRDRDFAAWANENYRIAAAISDDDGQLAADLSEED